MAGISINMLTGENGLLSKTEEAQEANRMATAKEKVELAIFASWDEQGNFNKEQFKKEIINQGGSIVKEDETQIVVRMDIYQGTVDLETKKIINFGKNTLSMEYQITPEEGVSTPYKNIKIIVKGAEGGQTKIKNDNNGQIIEGSEATFTVEENGDYTFTVTDQNGKEAKETVTISGIEKKKVLLDYNLGIGLGDFELGASSGGLASLDPILHQVVLRCYASGTVSGSSWSYAWAAYKNSVDFRFYRTINVYMNDLYNAYTGQDLNYGVQVRFGSSYSGMTECLRLETSKHLTNKVVSWTLPNWAPGSSFFEILLQRYNDGNTSSARFQEVYLTK